MKDLSRREALILLGLGGLGLGLEACIGGSGGLLGPGHYETVNGVQFWVPDQMVIPAPTMPEQTGNWATQQDPTLSPENATAQALGTEVGKNDPPTHPDALFTPTLTDDEARRNAAIAEAERKAREIVAGGIITHGDKIRPAYIEGSTAEENTLTHATEAVYEVAVQRNLEEQANGNGPQPEQPEIETTRVPTGGIKNYEDVEIDTFSGRVTGVRIGGNWIRDSSIIRGTLPDIDDIAERIQAKLNAGKLTHTYTHFDGRREEREYDLEAAVQAIRRGQECWRETMLSLIEAGIDTGELEVRFMGSIARGLGGKSSDIDIMITASGGRMSHDVYRGVVEWMENREVQDRLRKTAFPENDPLSRIKDGSAAVALQVVFLQPTYKNPDGLGWVSDGASYVLTLAHGKYLATNWDNFVARILGYDKAVETRLKELDSQLTQLINWAGRSA